MRSRCRAVRVVVALLCSALLLAGCRGGESGADPAESPAAGGSTGSTESSETPSEEPTPTIDPLAIENLDPCIVVPRHAWIVFVPKRLRAGAVLRPALVTRPLPPADIASSDTLPKFGCVVRTGVGTDEEQVRVAWGWYLGSVGVEDINRLDISGTKYDGGSWVGVTSLGLVSLTGLGIVPPDKSFWFAAPSSYTTDAISGRTDKTLEEAKKEVLKVLGFLSLSRHTQPEIMLPLGCPDARSPEVRAVLGRVAHARGTDDGEGARVCLYHNPRTGKFLRLNAGITTRQAVDRSAGTGGPDRFHAPDGAVGDASTNENGYGSGVMWNPDDLRYATADLSPDWLVGRSPRVPRAALIAVMQAAYDEVAAQ